MTITDEYLRRMQEAEFEAAFELFNTKPTAARTYAPQKPKRPLYLDPESGGPNPTVKIRYED